TPFVTAWIGENHFAPVPMALYGFDLLMAAIAYWILQRQILASEGPESLLARAVGNDFKGKVSPIIYFIAIPAAFVSVWISAACYVGVALMWLIPDRRIERALAGEKR
ncbi:MAG: TMEM175 family protein, partial [Gemmatimonadales bacterium]